MPMNANVKPTAKKAALLAARWLRRGVAARGTSTNGTEIRISLSMNLHFTFRRLSTVRPIHSISLFSRMPQ